MTRIRNMTVVRFQVVVAGPWRVGVVTQDDSHLGFYWVRPLGRHRRTDELPATGSIRIPSNRVRYHREWSRRGARS